MMNLDGTKTHAERRAAYEALRKAWCRDYFALNPQIEQRLLQPATPRVGGAFASEDNPG